MAWWTKIDGKVEKHSGPRPKMAAAIALNFARNLSGVPMDKLGLYKQDPEKHPDTPNLLPAEVEKANRRKS